MDQKEKIYKQTAFFHMTVHVYKCYQNISYRLVNKSSTENRKVRKEEIT